MEELRIPFNLDFLLDICKSIEGEEIACKLINEKSQTYFYDTKVKQECNSVEDYF